MLVILTYVDDLRRTDGRSWMRVAEDQAIWREVGEAYVQQSTVSGLMVIYVNYFEFRMSFL
jgi:hypothetical protein